MNQHVTFPEPPALWCQALSELSVRLGPSSVDLAGPKQRLLLAILLCHVNTRVSVDHLVDALWPEHPPRTAVKNLQVYVSKLRKVFGARLSHTGHGYRLHLQPQECDLLLFDEKVAHARALTGAGRSTEAALVLEQAMHMSTDRPLSEFETEEQFTAAIGTWRERYFGVLEDWAELRLSMGEGHAVVERLSPYRRRTATRERLGAAWMRALAAVGRESEALAHFEAVRRGLARDLGTEPGALLSAAHQDLLFPPEQPGSVALKSTDEGLLVLPRDVDGFVGRGPEIGCMVEHLSDHDRCPVLAVGPVGSGTSAVGVHVAHLLADRFPDGRILVGLRAADGQARTLASVLQELAETVGLIHPADQIHQIHHVHHARHPAAAARVAHRRAPSLRPALHHRPAPGEGPSPARLLAAWRTWITRRRVLLVLDNAVDEDVVRALLPPAGDSGVIVTGRSRLAGLDGVRRVPLPPLEPDESRDLLDQFAGPDRLDCDPQAAEGILDLCQGLPLAVRVTAERLATLNHLTPRDYLEHLRTAPTLLDEMAVGTLALRPRYEGLYQSLSEGQREAFTRLLDAGPENAAPAEAQCLLECGLLVTHQGSLRMPRFAREFGYRRIHTGL